MSNKRKVSRVLVMLEYGPDDPDNGEVFDLTALVRELGSKAEYSSAEIKMEVAIETDYDADWNRNGDARPTKCTVEWLARLLGGPRYSGLCRSGHLTDVINATLPDDERVTRLKATQEKLRQRMEKVRFALAEAKMDQVAQVRHLHPIARVSQAPLAAIGDE